MSFLASKEFQTHLTYMPLHQVNVHYYIQFYHPPIFPIYCMNLIPDDITWSLPYFQIWFLIWVFSTLSLCSFTLILKYLDLLFNDNPPLIFLVTRFCKRPQNWHSSVPAFKKVTGYGWPLYQLFKQFLDWSDVKSPDETMVFPFSFGISHVWTLSLPPISKWWLFYDGVCQWKQPWWRPREVK